MAAFLIAAIVVGLLWWLHARHFETTDDAYRGYAHRPPRASDRRARSIGWCVVDDHALCAPGRPWCSIDSAPTPRPSVAQAMAQKAQAQSQVEQRPRPDAGERGCAISQARPDVAAARRRPPTPRATSPATTPCVGAQPAWRWRSISSIRRGLRPRQTGRPARRRPREAAASRPAQIAGDPHPGRQRAALRSARPQAAAQRALGSTSATPRSPPHWPATSPRRPSRSAPTFSRGTS